MFINTNIDDNLRIRFNDVALRELGLDVDDHNKIYDKDTGYLVPQYGNKYIKYYEGPYDRLRQDEIALNLIDNPRMFEQLFAYYISKNPDIHIVNFYQSSTNKGVKGFFGCTVQDDNGNITKIESRKYLNESVRILDLLCGLRKTQNFYDFNSLDVI